jgi:hypothetical protein
VAVSFGIAICGSLLNGAYRNNLDGHLAGVPAHARETAQANGAGASALACHLPGATAGAVVRAANDA